MRFARLTTVYPQYLKQLYSENPELAGLGYANQLKAIHYDAFGWADFWTHALSQIGYETYELIANSKPLQLAWAVENGTTFDDKNWLLEIVQAQILKVKPEVLFIVDYETFSRKWIEELRKACPEIRLVLGWCGAPYNNADVFHAYDIVLSDTQEMVDEFLRMGHQAHVMRHGFDRRILERVSTKTNPSDDFTFIGSVVRASQFHLEREKILKALSRKTGIQIYCPEAQIQFGPRENLRFALAKVSYPLFSTLKTFGVPSDTLARVPKIGYVAHLARAPKYPIDRTLKPKMRPPVFGLKMFEKLRDSKLTFNCHINISQHSANNMRLYEATGMGTCLVTDWKENLHTFFELDSEVVTFKTADECAEKVRYLLDHPKERIAIAKQAQVRTHREHTWMNRAQGLDELIHSVV